MPDYHIGVLDEAAKGVLGGEGVAMEADSRTREVFLQPKAWTKGVLHAKKSVSWDTRIFTFKLNHDEQSLGLPIGQHLMIRLRDPATRETIIRAYTPISEESRKGYMELLVKVYFDTKERRGGKMSTAMDALPVGHGIDFKGPVGRFTYLGRGSCAVNGKERHIKTFVMICGGSGVTPILQIFRAIMSDEEDETRCIVLDGNRMFEDILCKDDLDAFQSRDCERAKLVYTLTKATEEWTGLRGRIAAPLLEEHAPVGENKMALICGPESLEKTVQEALLTQGWSDEDILFF